MDHWFAHSHHVVGFEEGQREPECDCNISTPDCGRCVSVSSTSVSPRQNHRRMYSLGDSPIATTSSQGVLQQENTVDGGITNAFSVSEEQVSFGSFGGSRSSSSSKIDDGGTTRKNSRRTATNGFPRDKSWAKQRRIGLVTVLSFLLPQVSTAEIILPNGHGSFGPAKNIQSLEVPMDYSI